jgi:hypothetical protein
LIGNAIHPFGDFVLRTAQVRVMLEVQEKSTVARNGLIGASVGPWENGLIVVHGLDRYRGPDEDRRGDG